MLRSAILLASENRILRRWVEHTRQARVLTSRFVAGNSLDEAVGVVQQINRDGMRTSLDLLGESVSNPQEAQYAATNYVRSVQRIAEQRLDSSISLKLTQLGLDLSLGLCRDNLLRIVDAATAAGVRVEVDMEASSHTDSTLQLVEEAHDRGGLVRAVIQAYLYRSREDIRRLNERGIPVRLCKGAYKESHAVAYPRKTDVDASFVELAGLLIREGRLPAIATHDDRMVSSALKAIEAQGLPPEGYEFQMLYGIRRDLQRSLAVAGHPVRLYLPYGDAWYPYLMRRMAERPANLLFVARNLFR